MGEGRKAFIPLACSAGEGANRRLGGEDQLSRYIRIQFLKRHQYAPTKNVIADFEGQSNTEAAKRKVVWLGSDKCMILRGKAISGWQSAALLPPTADRPHMTWNFPLF
jgi:hypothetical protein